MGPKPVAKVAVKVAPKKSVPKIAPKVVAKQANQPKVPEVKEKKEKKSKKDKKDVVDTGKEQFDAGLAAGKAQLDAGIAAFGSVTAGATDALQGWWGGLSVPSIPGLTSDPSPPPPPAKDSKKTATVAPPVVPPVKASPVPIAKAKAKLVPEVQPAVVPEKTGGGLFGMFRGQKNPTSKDSESGSIDISLPRQRAPGKPPLASAEDLRKEMESSKSVPYEKDESVLLAKRDHVVNSLPGKRHMEFNDLRPLPVQVHPSVAPRQTVDDPRNTAILSEIVQDPGLVTAGNAVDKVLQSRQFIEAMRRSVDSSKSAVENVKSSKMPIGPRRPISPMQDNISSVMFLPSPSGVCETCGLYTSSCICATLKRVAGYNAPDRNVLDRLFARMNIPQEDPDDERATVNSIKSINITNTKAGF